MIIQLIITTILFIYSLLGTGAYKYGGHKPTKTKIKEKEEIKTVKIGDADAPFVWNRDYTFKYLSDDRYIGRYMETKGYLFEKRTIVEAIRALKHKQGVVVDVGANIGTFAVPVSRERKVFAFEPQTKIYNLLSENSNYNHANVVAVKKCVGDRIMHVRMQTPDELKNTDDYDSELDLYNYGGVQIAEFGTGDTEMTTLDKFINEPVALIKVDVEGAEPLVFRGAQQTIKKYRPFIIYEHNNKTIPVEDFDIEEFCKKLGYRSVMYNINVHNKILIPDDEFVSGMKSFDKKGMKYYDYKLYNPKIW